MVKLSLRKIFQDRLFILFLLLLFLLLTIHVLVTFPPGGSSGINRVTGNAASLVVMAIAPLKDLGVPYKDYWEYKPPGIMLLIMLWAKLFGTSMTSFKALQLLFLLGTGPLFYLILKKIFSKFTALLVASLIVIVLYSPDLSCCFLHAELFGLFFSLLGLFYLLYLKDIAFRFFLAGFFFTLAFQMKDPFGSTIIATVPPLAYLLLARKSKIFFKALFFVVAGILVVFSLVFGYLSILGSLGAYFEVLNFKSQWAGWPGLGNFLDSYLDTIRVVKSTFFSIHSSLILVLGLWLLSCVSSLYFLSGRHFFKFVEKKDFLIINIRALRVRLDFKIFAPLTVVFYSLDSFWLFSSYHVFAAQHLYQVVPSLYFLWAILIKATLDNFQEVFPKWKITLLTLPILVVFLWPKDIFLKSYFIKEFNFQHLPLLVYRNLTLPDQDAQLERHISSKTSPGSCILAVYGWGYE